MEWEDVSWFTPAAGDGIPERPGWVLLNQLYQNDTQQSQVWLAEHPEAGRRVFKFFHDAGGGPERFLEVLHREVSLRQRLGPAGAGLVAPIVDSHLGRPEPHAPYAPFIALDYYSEGSLSAALRREAGNPVRPGSPAERTRLDLIAQVADRVHGLHLRGVYHGDVRGPNVLLEQNVRLCSYSAWLTDLGNGGHWGDPPDRSHLDPPPAAVPDRAPAPNHVSPGAESIEVIFRNDPVTPPVAPAQPAASPTPRDRILRDIAQVGTLLFQCVVSDFGPAGELKGAWQDRVRCRVLRTIIEDTQRGALSTAEALARRIRDVTAARLRRAVRRLAAAAVLLVATSVVTATGWWLSSENLRLSEEVRAQQSLAHEAETASAAERLRHSEELRTGEERARTAEIVRAGDLAIANGAWETGREYYRQALSRVDLTDQPVRARLRERALRASIFLDDLAGVDDELRSFDEHADSGAGPAVDLDRAVRLLERSMKEEAAAHEQNAVTLLRKVAESRQADLADRALARGFLALNYEEAAARFEEALVADPFHPYATVYLISTAMLAGRLETAARRTELWEMMNRKDPTPLLYRAFVLTLTGRRDAAEVVLKRISTDPLRSLHLPKETLDAYRAVIEIVAAIHAMLSDALIDPTARLQFIVLLGQKLPAAMGGFSQTGAFRVPFTPAQRRDFDQFLKAIKVGHMILVADPAKGLAELEHVGSFVAPGMKLFFEGKYHLDAGNKQAGAAALERAADSPSFFDVRRLCLLAAAGLKVTQSSAEPGERERLWGEARTLVRKAVAVGPVSPRLRPTVINLLMRCEGYGLAEELADAAGDKPALAKVRDARLRAGVKDK